MKHFGQQFFAQRNLSVKNFDVDQEIPKLHSFSFCTKLWLFFGKSPIIKSFCVFHY